MKGDVIHGSSAVRGAVRAHRVNDQGYWINETNPGLSRPLWLPQGDWQHNDVLYDWASIVSRLLADGSAGYRIGGMYLEYQNLADPEDDVTAPAFDRSGGIDYYNGLSGSPDIDYLRIPLVAATRTTSDADLFPDKNIATFFAQSQGVTGVHGKTFSDGVNSKVFGGALVAVPDESDRTQDLVFSRFYLTAGNQQVKLPNSQIGLEWQLTLA